MEGGGGCGGGEGRVEGKGWHLHTGFKLRHQLVTHSTHDPPCMR